MIEERLQNKRGVEVFHSLCVSYFNSLCDSGAFPSFKSISCCHVLTEAVSRGGSMGVLDTELSSSKHNRKDRSVLWFVCGCCFSISKITKCVKQDNHQSNCPSISNGAMVL